jgi:hypothetical protein
MSIVAEHLPLPRRDGTENEKLLPRRCRASTVMKNKLPLPRRDGHLWHTHPTP